MEELDKVLVNLRERLLDAGKRSNFFSKESVRKMAWDEIRKVYKGGVIEQIDDKLIRLILDAEELELELNGLVHSKKNLKKINHLKAMLDNLERQKEILLRKRDELEKEVASLWSVEVQEQNGIWQVVLRHKKGERKVAFSKGIIHMFRN